MKFVKYISFALLVTALFACKKEVIQPNTISPSAIAVESDETAPESSRIATQGNANQGSAAQGTVMNGGIISIGDDGGITDPNSDEDQNKKKKTKN